MISTNIPVVEVNHGIANNFGTYVEINKNLRKYPHLLNPILQHEFSHKGGGASMDDFKLDFIMTQTIHYKDMLKFMIKHPRSFTQLLPFYWSKTKGFVYDFNLMVMYLIMVCIFIGTFYLGVKLL